METERMNLTRPDVNRGDKPPNSALATRWRPAEQQDATDRQAVLVAGTVRVAKPPIR